MYEKAYHTADISQLRFLITGGAGFIGSHLAEYLVNQGAGQVTVLDNLSTGSEENIAHLRGADNFSFIKGDINDAEVIASLCAASDHVLHQAAIGSVPRSIEHPLASHEANATGFLSVLEACRKTDVKRLIFASSSSVYGDSLELPKKEENLGAPKSPYAITKLIDEHYASLYHRMHGMEVIGLRYFNIFGPRQNPKGPYAAAIPLFILAALAGERPVVYGDGEQSRDFTFVANAVKANMLAIFSSTDCNGQFFNVACGKRYSLNEVMSQLAGLLGREISPEYREERIGDIKHSQADITKISQLMGFEAEVQLGEGLEKALRWYQENYERSSSTPMGQ